MPAACPAGGGAGGGDLPKLRPMIRAVMPTWVRTPTQVSATTWSRLSGITQSCRRGRPSQPEIPNRRAVWPLRGDRADHLELRRIVITLRRSFQRGLLFRRRVAATPSAAAKPRDTAPAAANPVLSLTA